jgi:putative transposase
MRRSKIVSPMHFVFATRDRLPLITPEVEPQLWRLLTEQAQRMKCQVLAVGGMPDHIHIAVLFPATITYMEFVKQLKGSASRILKQAHLQTEDYFYWQKGYGAFGFSRTEIDRIVTYIHEQKERHARRSLWLSLEEVDEPALESTNVSDQPDATPSSHPLRGYPRCGEAA